jgi:cytochrome c
MASNQQAGRVVRKLLRLEKGNGRWYCPNDRRNLLLAITAAFVAACGAGDAPQAAPDTVMLTAATLGEQRIIANADYLQLAPYADADPAAGEAQAQVCRACHSLEKGGPNMIGPNLYGLFGRQAGQTQGFAYSEVLAAARFVWTPRALDAWLIQPGRFLPGNRMVFPGVPDAGDRADLIAYLLTVTDADRD